MGGVTKGSRPTRTMGGLVDQRRIRTPAGALLELSGLASEKKRLNTEIKRWERRSVDIQARLADIAEKEARLMKVVTAATPNAVEVFAARATADATAAGTRMKVKEFSY
jgi:hypothetical protein